MGTQRRREAAGPRCRGAGGGRCAPDPPLRRTAGLLRQPVLALQRHGAVCQVSSVMDFAFECCSLAGLSVCSTDTALLSAFIIATTILRAGSFVQFCLRGVQEKK